ncbi:hypothetical protein KC963_02045 [Candidatus Saccharibacteria bacterium]|nr:hypothetical protein [Candidatus Saccharibacteria bacterium]
MYNKENGLSDFTEKIDAMRKEEDANAARLAPAGWMVKVGHGYSIGNGHSAFEHCTPFSKFAKIGY